MSATIDIYEYSKAEVGWGYLSTLIQHLARTDSKVELVYLFDTHELVITDDILIKALDQLNIPYKEIPPSNTLKFILKK